MQSYNLNLKLKMSKFRSLEDQIMKRIIIKSQFIELFIFSFSSRNVLFLIFSIVNGIYSRIIKTT